MKQLEGREAGLGEAAAAERNQLQDGRDRPGLDLSVEALWGFLEWQVLVEFG